MRRRGEGRVDGIGVAIVIVERDIVRNIVIEQGRAVFRRVFRRGHRRQGFDIDA